MVNSLFLIAAIIIAYYFGQRGNKKLQVRLENVIKNSAVERQMYTGLRQLNEEQANKIAHQEGVIKTLTHQKKSSEVRTGQIAEQVAPFLDGFMYDSKDIRFLGNPIDFIAFTETGVHFIEVKSGGSQLTSKQRAIRDLIQRGDVTFEVFRIKGK